MINYEHMLLKAYYNMYNKNIVQLLCCLYKHLYKHNASIYTNKMYST